MDASEMEVMDAFKTAAKAADPSLNDASFVQWIYKDATYWFMGPPAIAYVTKAEAQLHLSGLRECPITHAEKFESKQKNIEFEVPEEEIDNSNLLCAVCNEDDESQDASCSWCSLCQRWFHAKCVKHPQKNPHTSIKSWYCDRCTAVRVTRAKDLKRERAEYEEEDQRETHSAIHKQITRVFQRIDVDVAKLIVKDAAILAIAAAEEAEIMAIEGPGPVQAQSTELAEVVVQERAIVTVPTSAAMLYAKVAPGPKEICAFFHIPYDMVVPTVESHYNTDRMNIYADVRLVNTLLWRLNNTRGFADNFHNTAFDTLLSEMHRHRPVTQLVTTLMAARELVNIADDNDKVTKALGSGEAHMENVNVLDRDIQEEASDERDDMAMAVDTDSFVDDELKLVFDDDCHTDVMKFAETAPLLLYDAFMGAYHEAASCVTIQAAMDKVHESIESGMLHKCLQGWPEIEKARLQGHVDAFVSLLASPLMLAQ